MRVTMFLIGLFVLFAGCSYPVILVGPRPKDSPPRIESWVKADTSAERRVLDSQDCGGTQSGSNFTDKEVEAERRPNEGILAPLSRLHHKWERCMLGKGYQYTGQCLDNPVSSSRPACGAP